MESMKNMTEFKQSLVVSIEGRDLKKVTEGYKLSENEYLQNIVECPLGWTSRVFVFDSATGAWSEVKIQTVVSHSKQFIKRILAVLSGDRLHCYVARKDRNGCAVLDHRCFDISGPLAGHDSNSTDFAENYRLIDLQQLCADKVSGTLCLGSSAKKQVSCRKDMKEVIRELKKTFEDNGVYWLPLPKDYLKGAFYGERLHESRVKGVILALNQHGIGVNRFACSDNDDVWVFFLLEDKNDYVEGLLDRRATFSEMLQELLDQVERAKDHR